MRTVILISALILSDTFAPFTGYVISDAATNMLGIIFVFALVSDIIYFFKD